MQTQGILLNVSAMQSRTTGKATKVSESTFDSFMSQNASQATVRKTDQYSADQSKKISKTGGDISSTGDDFNQHKISLTSGKQGQNSIENVDLAEVETEVVTLLQKTFGMSEEDIVDILEMLGMAPMDLVLLMSQDSVDITLINVENIKALIMEVHGIDDENMFLMSDKMSGELSDLMSGIQEILSEQLGVLPEELSDTDNKLLQSFAEKIGQIVDDAEKNGQEQDAFQNLSENSKSDEIPVVVETSDGAGMSDTQESSAQTMSEQVRDAHGAGESPINAFVERLSESFENVRQDQVVSDRVTMNSIVEQVVNHVRIRVLPQTTSMELQLNPESLGRVNLNVTSNNGVATATLTVQNQVAKEALESQITVLKENLENHGLKVDSVEVNVSEFGFKNQEDSNNNQFRQKKTAGRRFRFDVANDTEEETAAEVAEARQDGDSVVDYTA